MVYYDEPPESDTSPAGRAAVMAEIAAARQRRAQELVAVPERTGHDLTDLSAAIDAVGEMERQWDEADRAFRNARADASPFGDVAAWEAAGRLEQERARCWQLLERATANRDRIQAAEDRLRDMPDMDLGEWR